MTNLLIHDKKGFRRALAQNISKSKLSHLIPDEHYVKYMYKAMMGKRLNLKDPKSYTEKLQWLKLYNRKSIYTTMVDKYDVKNFVADSIGDEYIIKTLGLYDKFEDIDFDALPNRFVLKCTHDSGSVVICYDKRTFNVEKAKEKLTEKMKKGLFWHGREWPYKNLKPRIIAEEYLEDAKTEELRDYKFFTFNGESKLMFVASDRHKADETKFDFYDMNYNHLDIINGHPCSEVFPEKPVNFEQMKILAEKLSKGIPHLRVDFYEVNGKIYFGELTFFHWCGFVPFEPEEWDYKLGEWIDLSKIEN